MEATGNLQKTTIVESIMNRDMLCTDVVGLIGEPFDIETESQFNKATITFKVDKSKLGDTEFDNLLFLWYNEENYEFVELETDHDEENSTVSIETTHFSKYMLVDLNEWCEAWSQKVVVNLEAASDFDLKTEPIYDIYIGVNTTSDPDSNDPFYYDSDGKIHCTRIDIIKELASVITDQRFSFGIHLYDGIAIGPMWDYKDEPGYQYYFDYYNHGFTYEGPIDLSAGIYCIADWINHHDFYWGTNNTTENLGRLPIAIFIISDDYYSSLSWNEQRYRDYLQDCDGPIYIIDLRGTNDPILRTIADTTGGKYLANTEENINYLKDLISRKTAVFPDIDDNKAIIPSEIKDFDFDGFLDEQETTGIRIQNGRMITTNPKRMDTDDDGLSDGKEISTELQYKDTPVYNTTTGETIQVAGYYYVMYSDPRIGDADYDGIPDDVDQTPTENGFFGLLTTVAANTTYTNYIEYRMDYRNFFKENQEYNSELAVLGSIFACMAYTDSSLSITDGADFSGAAEDLYKAYGLIDYEDYRLADYYPDDDISEINIGHRKVGYNNQVKEIVFISVRGTDATIEEWSSNFDVGADIDAEYYWDRDNVYWRTKENHKGFDVAANRLYDYINSYIDRKIVSDDDVVLYIVGHSRGAAIANILGAKYEKNDEYNYETFVYAFATPRTTQAEDYNTYETIFNIVNEDDLVPYLPLETWGFHRYGKTLSTSIKDNYENKFLWATWDQWEAMYYIDYNYNNNLKNTLEAFKEIADSREALYMYTSEEDTIYTFYDSYCNNGPQEVKNRINKYGKRISKYCRVTPVFNGESYDIKVEQTPAFLMMVLAELAASKEHQRDKQNNDFIKDYSHLCDDEDKFIGSAVSFYVAKKYIDAKDEFIHSAADSKDGITRTIRYGGMVHAHMPATYYFLSNDYKNKLKEKKDFQ